MIFNFFLESAIVAFSLLSTVVSAHSESNVKRRRIETEALLPAVPGYPIFGGVFDYYNDLRILGSRLEDPEIDTGLGEDGGISYYAHKRRAVDRTQSLERRNGASIKTEVELTPHMGLGGEVTYTGFLAIGPGGTRVAVKFDTGSFDTWISEEECAMIREKQSKNNRGRVMAHPDELKKDYNPKQGTKGLLDPNSAKGDRLRANVNIGDLKLSQYVLGCMRGTTEAFAQKPFNGIVGLGLPGLSVEDTQPPLDAAYQRHQIEGVFAFHLSRTLSRLYIGWIGDTNLFHEKYIEYHQVSRDLQHSGSSSGDRYSYWSMVDKAKIKVNGNVIQNVKTAIVTGMHRIYGPVNIVDSIYKMIPGAKRLDYQHEQLYSFPCVSQFTVSFSWNGVHEWVFTPESFILMEDNGWCLGAIQARPALTGNTFMLGTSFMRIAHVVFEMPSKPPPARSEAKPPRIGLGPLKRPW